jgi:phospholipase C
LKFIEKNWNLAPLSQRSRDNLPDPIAATDNPYVPTNGPAIGDLMTIFDFAHKQPSPPLVIPGGI